MQINGQLLYKFLGRQRMERAGLAKKAFGNVVYRVRRFYCVPLTISRHCPLNCSKCHETLVTVLDDIHPETAKDPEALLVFGLKRAVASMNEISHQAVVRTSDNFGTRDTTSIWDAMLQQVPI